MIKRSTTINTIISLPVQSSLYQECIQACRACAAACDATAMAAFPGAQDAAMAESIRFLRECACICRTAVGFMASGGHFVKEACDLCARICQACAAACAKQAHEYFQRCVQACNRCIEACLTVRMVA